jgi:hypothetical protein
MDNTIKELIESTNDSSLVAEFVHLVSLLVPLIIPVFGAIALGFFGIRIARRLLHV